ncbi:hypothetical protein, partial [Francisella sp. 19X1-34]|uniref:hypothetical protein n=1 Tax=Francisella sp. 19X1-34 TaxID=3087177 RepID=UPI002E33FED2
FCKSLIVIFKIYNLIKIYTIICKDPVHLLTVQIFIIFPLICLSSTIVFYMQSVEHLNAAQAVVIFSISFSLIWGGDWFGITVGNLVNRHQTIIVGILYLFL